MPRSGMVGAVAQLAAFGAADQFLSAQPQITYFKQIWRRHTQFAMESIEQSWAGDVDFGKKATVELSQTGDLVTEVWLQIRLPDLATLNHIPNATPLPAEPVVYYARQVAQSRAEIKAYTCPGSENFLAVLRAGADSGVAVRLDGTSLVVTLPSTPLFGPALVPLDPSGEPVVLTGAGLEWTSPPLTPGTTYALCFNGDIADRTHVLRLATTSGPSASFSVAGLDPRADYSVRVLTTVGSQVVASLPRWVLKAKWCNSVGHAFVQSVEWEIGGSSIDRHTAEHFDILSELTDPAEKRAGYDEMIGRFEDYDINDDAKSFGGPRVLFVPLRFSFNTKSGSALPLVALQFHKCRLNFEFRSFLELVKTNVPLLGVEQEPSLPECKLFATYVFLSQEERQRFAQMPHEYLIEQLQAQVENVAAASSVGGVVNRKIPLTLNHPVKEIVFVYHASTNIAKDTVAGNNWFDYDIPGRRDEEIFEAANIQMNGHDRFVKRPAKYWRLVQPYSHHTRVPSKRVHCYSFALHPEKWENPSGAANFSRIDTAHLNLSLNPDIPAGRVRIHALGYNVLRIVNGLGGLVFAG